MTLTLKSAAKYLAFSLFLAVVYLKFGSIFIITASLILAIVLGGVVLAKRLQASVPAVLIYLYLFFGVVNFIVGGSFYDMAFPVSLPFFPLLVIHYLNTAGKKIPGIIPFFIMLFGFLVSIIYQTLVHGGAYNFKFLGDQQLIFVFIFFFSLYMLFSFRILSLWKVVFVLSVSVLPEIIYIFLLYLSQNSLGLIFHERLGCSVGIPANQIAVWLDIAFPLALLIALYDKRPRLKIFFSVLAMFYGAAVLLTASRGSMVGLPFIPFFIASKSKSIITKLIILVVSLSAFGIFGRGIVERTLFPTRADVISNLGRRELLRAGISVLKSNHYFFGIGIDNYRTEKYNFDFMSSFDTKSAMSTHNGFVEIWLGWGFIGLTGWLVFLGQGIARAARARLRPEMSYLKPALLLAIFISLTHALFDSVITCFPFMIFFLSLIACAFFLGESDDVRQPLINDGTLPGGIKLHYAAGP